MSELRVIKYGNPILRMKAKHIENIDSDVKQLANDMITIMQGEEGIGLAAPQVAQSISLLVVDMSLIDEEGEPTAFINPEILTSEGESVLEEGCLSLPDIREDVKRPEIITLRYQNIEGEVSEKRFDELLARVLQHEIDHLNGVLFVDRISSLKKKMFNKKLKEIATEERVEIV
ncbi:peptide deformylase [candidate division KSB1 bacterium]|nr:peptide deformylase [candidate division KSB1 bacterium]